jgi:hypothetical protein
LASPRESGLEQIKLNVANQTRAPLPVVSLHFYIQPDIALRPQLDTVYRVAVRKLMTPMLKTAAAGFALLNQVPPPWTALGECERLGEC